MNIFLLVALAASVPGQSKVDPDQFPLALHRSMEIDDLDREIQRLHDTVLLKRAQLASSQRLANRNLLSREELERETADVLYNEAREAESIAYRALKVYERDVLGQAAPTDEKKAFSLILEWVRRQQAIAKVDVDFRAFSLKRTRALYNRSTVSRQELDEAELAHDAALASLAMSRSREAQVLMELAARSGEKLYSATEYHRLKTEYLEARVRYFEITADGVRRRRDIARDRSRVGLIPANELPIFERAATDAEIALEAERKALAEHKASPPSSNPPSRPSVPRVRT